MIEKKKSHKPLPKTFTLTICQSGVNSIALGKIYNCSHKTILNIAKGKTWRNV